MFDIEVRFFNIDVEIRPLILKMIQYRVNVFNIKYLRYQVRYINYKTSDIGVARLRCRVSDLCL